MTLSKYQAILGTLPRQWDVARWTEEHFQQFFSLVQDLTIYGETSAKIECTESSIKELEEKIFNETPSYRTELLYRINQFTTDPNFSPRKFYYRITALIRSVGNYVKKHPAILSETNREQIKNNPRLNWMSVSYTAYQTKMGAIVPVPEARDTTTYQTQPAARVVDPQTKLLNSMVLLADSFEVLAKSLTKRELRAMKAQDKISAISKLSFLFGNRVKPNIGVFRQINVFKASKDDLEKSLLAYSEGE